MTNHTPILYNIITIVCERNLVMLWPVQRRLEKQIRVYILKGYRCKILKHKTLDSFYESFMFTRKNAQLVTTLQPTCNMSAENTSCHDGLAIVATVDKLVASLSWHCCSKSLREQVYKKHPTCQ